MAEIGKSLLFYLKYYPEMSRLHGDADEEIPELEERPDHKEILEKSHTVGDAACNEAANLLELCTSDWMKQLESAKAARFSQPRRAAVERNWQLIYDVRPPRSRKMSSAVKCQVGIELDRGGLTPWAWARGGVTIEDSVRKLFPRDIKIFGSRDNPEWSGGVVFFKPIEIPWKSAVNFTLDADPIIERARKALEVMNPKFIQGLLALHYG